MPFNKPDYSKRPERDTRPDRDSKKPYSARGGDARNSRPDQGAAPKKRWTGDDRAARTGDRPSSDRRPDWNPREKPAYGDRPNRSNGAPSSDRPSRPAYGDRPARPSYGDRNERPSYNDRNSNSERPARTERPSYGDRPARPSYGERTERPAYNGDRPARTERPSYGDRPATNDRKPRTPYNERSERPSYNSDRPARTERPSYGNDRPSYNSDRPARTERPSYNSDRPARTERPSYGNDRPSYNSSNERAERPARTERPSYADRNERPSYGSDRGARTERPSRDSAYYPGADKSHSGGGIQEDVVLERLEAAVITATDVEGVTFGDLGLGANIVRQLESMGAAAPFAIQAATIPDVLAGKDVLGRGKTGSGKTIAFGAPLVERLMENNGGKDRQAGRKPRALILAPTRELAMQIDRTVQPIARSVGLFTTTIVGGVPQYKQVSALQRGVDIIIATPGRVEDLIEQGRLDLSNVIVSVLDEADHMCDLGFLEPVQRILKETKDGGQKLLFSATLDKGVATLVKQFLKNPSVHEVAGEDQASSTIDHKVLLIEQRDKRAIIEQLSGGSGKTLVFTRTRAFAEEMSEFLEDAGIPATSLHGDLNQSRRTRNLQMLTSGRVNVLVATDVAARGIHVDDISLVIQADAPEEYKTYLHRSGRTGRAGKVGTVVTLIPRARRRKMDELLGRADIKAEMINVAPGDKALDDLAAL
jgi:superfamily II DNA/RNA helicase